MSANCTGKKSLGNQGRTSIHSLTAMYSCALRDKATDCRLKQPAVSASLRSVQGAAPLAALCAYPCLPQKGEHPPCVCPPSEGLTTEHTDTLTAHRRRPGGRSFFYPFFSQRWATPFTWPAADRRRRTPSAGTGIWSGKPEDTSHFPAKMIK